MTFFGGVSGECVWAYFVDGVTDEDWDQYMAFNEMDPLPIAPVLLTIAVRSSPPNASQRKRLTQFMRDNPQKLTTVRASAVVVDSDAARASLTAIGWLARKPFPEKCFARPKEALIWLVGHASALRPPDVLADIRAHAPPNALGALRSVRP